jgi:hypothetical protein
MCTAWAQKATLGCEDSVKDKHCANHVTPLCPELLFSSGLKNITVLFRLRIIQILLPDHKTINLRVIIVLFSLYSPFAQTLCVQTFLRQSVKCIASNLYLTLQQHNSKEQQQHNNPSGDIIVISQSL